MVGDPDPLQESNIDDRRLWDVELEIAGGVVTAVTVSRVGVVGRGTLRLMLLVLGNPLAVPSLSSSSSSSVCSKSGVGSCKELDDDELNERDFDLRYHSSGTAKRNVRAGLWAKRVDIGVEPGSGLPAVEQS